MPFRYFRVFAFTHTPDAAAAAIRQMLPLPAAVTSRRWRLGCRMITPMMSDYASLCFMPPLPPCFFVLLMFHDCRRFLLGQIFACFALNAASASDTPGQMSVDAATPGILERISRLRHRRRYFAPRYAAAAAFSRHAGRRLRRCRWRLY